MNWVAKNRKSKLKNQNLKTQFADWFTEMENINQSISKREIDEEKQKRELKTETKKEIIKKPVLEILRKTKGEKNSPDFYVGQNSIRNPKQNFILNQPKVLSKEEFLNKNKNIDKILKEKKEERRKEWKRKSEEIGEKPEKSKTKFTFKKFFSKKNNEFLDTKNKNKREIYIQKNEENEKNKESLKKFLENFNKKNEKEIENNFETKINENEEILKEENLEEESKKNSQDLNLIKNNKFSTLKLGNLKNNFNFKKNENPNHLQNYFGTKNHFINREFENFSARFYENVDNFSKKIQNLNFSLSDLFSINKSENLIFSRIYKGFAFLSIFFILGFAFFSFVGSTFAVKENVLDAGEKAKDNIKLAINHLENQDFKSAELEFEKAYLEINFANEEMNKINELVILISEFIPKASQLSSGKKIIEAGKFLTHAGTEINNLAKITTTLTNSEDLKLNEINWLELYQKSMKHISVIYKDFEKAKKNIDEVNLDDLPENYKNKFSTAKKMMPFIEENLKIAVDGQKAIEEILGSKGPRTYLFLFQNNHEMRATGGFIGSYGIMEISNGKITNFKIDNIFNPDGQLIDRIVPPLPIQKISADWSLHDSNWFPNFPTSAEKAIDFYERTGGQTIDGVITITPTVIKELLKTTGPIKIKNYDLEITEENFMEMIQTEVEINYNEKETDPKKILSDLSPLIFEKLLENKSPKNIIDIINTLSTSLNEKHILIYMRNDFIQEIVRKNGWSGEMIETDKDYLSVINTNINGFKSDGMIYETIEHSSEIFEDGSVINTVTITREHRGGKTGFSWWDAVNSDYMRVYVPKGSKLLSAEGQTREINEEKLDYDKLEYTRDKDLKKELENTIFDEKTGTKVYEENEKTVFANWVYVSPQEKVKVTYKYILPFKIKFKNENENRFGYYAILYQKQAGSENSKIKSAISLPNNFKLHWKTNKETTDLTMQKDLKTDLYHGIVFEIK